MSKSNSEVIKPEVLLNLMTEVLNTSTNFYYIGGTQPFFMKFREKNYYVYVKNLSSAYFAERDRTTRAQLPIRKEFEAIKSSPYPFIFLGYDGVNDVFVCWNHHTVKKRLNVAKSVSFYSRTFFQTEVKDGEIIRRQLKNGDFPVFFTRSSLVEFFENLESLFPNKITLEFDQPENLYNTNYEDEYQRYLRNTKNLSEKTITNYSQALKGKISEGLRKHSLALSNNIFFISDHLKLLNLNKLLFELDEFRIIDKRGKSMYSCAFNSYVAFIEHLRTGSIPIAQELSEQYVKKGKLVKIMDPVLLTRIKPYIHSNRLLSAAQIASNHYEQEYPNMNLSDWMNLVRNS